MKKGENKLKKIIYFIGLLALAVVIVLNILFTAVLDNSEHITIQFNNLFYVLGLIGLGLFLFFATKITDKHLCKTDSAFKSKLKKFLFIGAFALYILFMIIWCIVIRPPIVGDQIHACNLAQTFYSGNLEEYLPNMTYAGIPLSEYMQAYHQQISLSFVFSLFFRIIHFDGIGVLRVLNIIGNIFVVIALFKIGKQLSKKYAINKVLLLTLIFTFVSLPMLSTFIYGDIPSLALCLFAVYFMMRYIETKQMKYAVFASICTMFAYMMRMNSLIFIIATVIYLVLALLKEISQKTWKEVLLRTGIIVMFIAISLIPSSLVKNIYLHAYHLDKTKAYPNISYFLMAMEEGPRANGWYNEAIGEPALKDPENKKIEYAQKIKDRLGYFTTDIGYTFDFYTTKLASMWAENTYSAVFNNVVDEYDLEGLKVPLTFYQKALLLTICFCSLIVLIQNRKNISLELLFLITIFIGGFAFHILWEAKSRYIIPYIVVLIPVASVAIRNFKLPRNKLEKNEK